MVSFAPMEDLGVDQKYLKPSGVRLLGTVAGSYTYFADGDVLLAKITPCFENGKLGIAHDLQNGIGFGSSEYFVIRPSSRVTAEYLYYFLSQPSFREAGAQSMTGAVGHKRVAKEFLEGHVLPLPPLPEQQRIVAILDEAFAGIATARAAAEQNRQNAHALFESHLQSVFSQRGEGWVENGKPLSDMCELIVDCEHKTAPTQESGHPSIRTTNIGKGKFLLDGVYRVSDDTYREWTRRAVPQTGDLIFAREAPAGNVAVVPDGLNPCLGQRTVLIRPNTNYLNPNFLALLLLSSDMQEHLLSHSRGATVQHINMKDIRALKLGPIPNAAGQEGVVRRFSGFCAEQERLEALYQRKLEALNELKQSLLHQAFSGAL